MYVYTRKIVLNNNNCYLRFSKDHMESWGFPKRVCLTNLDRNQILVKFEDKNDIGLWKSLANMRLFIGKTIWGLYKEPTHVRVDLHNTPDTYDSYCILSFYREVNR